MSDNGVEHRRDGERVTWIGAFCNAFLIVCKLLAGIFGDSHAMLADAVHSISDLFTDAVVLLGLRMGRKAPDAEHHFGHGRIETLAASGVAASLIVLSFGLGYKAIEDLHHHHEVHPTWLALAGAVLSIGVKEALYRYTVHVGHRIRSTAVVANAWHHRSDALSSVAVLIGVGGALLRPEWHVLDAYATLVVSFFVVRVGGKMLWASLREMVDTAPPAEILDRIRACVHRVPGVLKMHGLKVRSSGGLYFMHVRVVVDGSMSVAEGHEICQEVERCVVEEIGNVGEIIVHVDPAEPGRDF